MPAQPLPQVTIGSEELRRNMHEARRALRASPQYQRRATDCPAGACVGETPRGVAVRCRIEGALIAEGDSPGSLVEYCMGDHTACPTWRAERERELQLQRRARRKRARVEPLGDDEIFRVVRE